MFSEIFECFTKAYKEETRYREFTRQMLPHLKLKSEVPAEKFDVKIGRLIADGFVSNFSIKIGRF